MYVYIMIESYVHIPKKSFIFFSLSRVVRGDLRAKRHLFSVKYFFFIFFSPMKENDLTLAETSFELFSTR
jgi:hypothetical protein